VRLPTSSTRGTLTVLSSDLVLDSIRVSSTGAGEGSGSLGDAVPSFFCRFSLRFLKNPPMEDCSPLSLVGVGLLSSAPRCLPRPGMRLERLRRDLDELAGCEPLSVVAFDSAPTL